MHLSQALALIQHAGWDSPTPAHWADLGCGDGVFTEALTRLLPPQSHVHAVDTDLKALSQVPDVPRRTISRLRLDFIQEPWLIADLDGVLMANSLHYVQDKRAFLEKAIPYLVSTGRFLLVEYDTTAANSWVPYPLPFAGLAPLFAEVGFETVRKLGEQPSQFHNGNLYAAVVER